MRAPRSPLVALIVLAAIAPAARAQQGAYRFELTGVGDSTITFAVADAPWVKPGQRGIAVDPARHDALVARLVVLRLTGAVATAVVTAQTTPLTLDDVALIAPPRRRWYQVPAVWIGSALGVALGLLIAR